MRVGDLLHLAADDRFALMREKNRAVSPGNWKTIPQKPCAIGIEPFSNAWKKAENAEKVLI
jgi:hypothetical protein